VVDLHAAHFRGDLTPLAGLVRPVHFFALEHLARQLLLVEFDIVASCLLNDCLSELPVVAVTNLLLSLSDFLFLISGFTNEVHVDLATALLVLTVFDLGKRALLVNWVATHEQTQRVRLIGLYRSVEVIVVSRVGLVLDVGAIDLVLLEVLPVAILSSRLALLP